MGDWFKVRASAIGGAFGVRRYMLAPTIGAVVGFVDWVFANLREAGMGHLIGVPSWAVGVLATLLLIVWWFLEYAVKLRRQLAPKINSRFERDKGGLTETTLTTPNGELHDHVKYVRLTVETASKTAAKCCMANLTKIERRLDLQRTKVLWEDDPLPLQWSMVGGYESDIYHLVKRFVDVCHVLKEVGKPQILSILPNRLTEPFSENGIFILTIVVTSGDISEESKIEIEATGDWETFDARPI